MQPAGVLDEIEVDGHADRHIDAATLTRRHVSVTVVALAVYRVLIRVSCPLRHTGKCYQSVNQQHIYYNITLLAVSTRPPDGANYCLGPAGLCPPYLSHFAVDLFSRPFGPLSGGGNEFY